MEVIIEWQTRSIYRGARSIRLLKVLSLLSEDARIVVCNYQEPPKHLPGI